MKTSPYRLRTRAILAQVLREHAGCTPKEMRKHCRQAFQKAMWPTHVHGQRIRREETNIALGETLTYKNPKPVPADTIMPAMREWAAAHGLIKLQPTTDVWQPT